MALLKHRKETFKNWVDLVVNDNTDENTEYTLTSENRIVGRAVGNQMIAGGDYIIGKGSTLSLPAIIFEKTNLRFKALSYGFARTETKYYTAKKEGELNTAIHPYFLNELGSFNTGNKTFMGSNVNVSASLTKEDFGSGSSIIGTSSVNSSIEFISIPNNNQTFLLKTESESGSDKVMVSYIFINV